MRKSNFLSTIVGRGDRGIGWMLVLSLLAHALVMVLALLVLVVLLGSLGVLVVVDPHLSFLMSLFSLHLRK